MSCSRMGFNLFTAAGWRNLLSRGKRWRWVWRHAPGDTVMPLYCWVFGHRVEFDYSGEPVCHRCHQYLRHMAP